MTKVNVTPINLLKLIKQSIQIGKIENAIGIIDDAIEQMETEEKKQDGGGE